MKKIVIIVLVFWALGLHAVTEKKVSVKNGPIGGQAPMELNACTYYKRAGGGFAGGFIYSCVTLTKEELNGVIKKLSEPAIAEKIIDDQLIAALTSSKDKFNEAVARVLSDHKGKTIKNALESIKKQGTLKRIADVLPLLMGD